MLAIVAGILVARHLKSAEELHEWRSTPKTESLVASAVNWAERIMNSRDASDLRIALKKSGDFAEVLYFVGVPDGTTFNRFRLMRSRVYHACDMSGPGRGGRQHGAVR